MEKCKFGAISLNEYGVAEIDEEKCIGCAACAKQCPEVFAFDKERRRASVRPDAVPEEHEAAVRDAALICLVGNIKVTDE